MSTENRKGNFIFTIELLPQVSFYLQDVSIPTVSMGETIIPNQVLDYSVPGDKLIYDKLLIAFLVDEDIDNYAELYKWLIDMRNPETNIRKTLYSDATLTILTNNKNPLREIKFFDCFPITVDALTFNYNADPAEVQIGSATLSYTYFKILPKK